MAHAHAWYMHGMCMVCAWYVHGVCMDIACASNQGANPNPHPRPSPNSSHKPTPNLNQGASATTDSEAAEAAEAGEAGKAAPQLLAVALQDGPRGPEVSNLQTDSAELFYAVSSK